MRKLLEVNLFEMTSVLISEMKKISLFIFLIFATSNIAYAEQKCSKRTLTISDWKEVPTSWTDCIGKIKFGRKSENRRGNKYVGGFKDSRMHGQGTYTWAGKRKGQKYVGESKDGKWHGQGTMTYADGDKYVGEWKDGKRNGQGTMTYADGDKYVGEYKDDKRNGQGTYTWGDGEWKGQKYVGESKDGKWHGQGTYTWANGDKYVGEWKDNKYHGQGTYEREGIKAVGEWKDGEQIGKVMLTYRGDQLSTDLPYCANPWTIPNEYRCYGVGRLTLHNDGIYFGEWRGTGGTEYTHRSGRGYMTWPNGNKFVGEWESDNIYGLGIFTWANGAKYGGYWHRNNREGQGEMTWPNGDKYVGEWFVDRREGEGTLTYADGRIESGIWDRDKFVGSKKFVQKERERTAKIEMIYENCLLAKPSRSVRRMDACAKIARDPSFLDELKYSD